MKLDLLPELLDDHPLTDDRPWYVVVDLDLVEARWNQLVETFPDWLHAVAIKAHPRSETLELLVEHGAGMEAASWQECEIALAAGCPPGRIVFDSPAKTRAELARALDRGILINVDNLTELHRLAELLDGRDGPSVGLRVNPEVDPSSIGALSTGSPNSKFGVSLTRQREEVVAAFARHRWLRRLHVHIGSKGYGPDELARGLTSIIELGAELDVDEFDIGGGLPPAVSPGAYRAALERLAPALFEPGVTVITEFGRWLFTHAAVAISRVEYVKPGFDRDIATIHFGADFMLRNAYQPGVWKHPIEVFGADGSRKYGEPKKVTIGGPLCFGGDVIARDATLPPIAEGDVLVVRDVGAYTFGMWSRFCSRPPPTFVFSHRGRTWHGAAHPQ